MLLFDREIFKSYQVKVLKVKQQQKGKELQKRLNKQKMEQKVSSHRLLFSDILSLRLKSEVPHSVSFNKVICKICETGFILVSSPITNPQIPTSSKSIFQELGISIPICRHSICQPCLLSYIDLNLKEARSQRKRIFPLICPGCDDEDSTKTKGSIDDETLKKVMDCENQN